MILSETKAKFKTKHFLISSLICGFLLIPIHELGHVLFQWISGNPASMSYARSYILGNGKDTLIGVLGGLIFPILISVILLMIIINKSKYYELLLPLIILGSTERAIQYLFGITPSDEKIVSDFLLYNVDYVKLIFVLIPVIINSVLLFFMFRVKFKVIQIFIIYVVVIVSFVIMASFGVFIVEKYLFPEQYNIQFG